MIETAVSRDKNSPNFAGLEDSIRGGPTSSTGQANTRVFRDWITTQMRNQAQIWKDTALYQHYKPGKGVGALQDDEDGVPKRTKGGGGRGAAASP